MGGCTHLQTKQQRRYLGLLKGKTKESTYYVNNEMCSPKNAVSLDVDFKIEKGFYFKYLSSRGKIKCWVHGNSERSKRILSGKALKID